MISGNGDRATWQVAVDGLVENPRLLSLAELQAIRWDFASTWAGVMPSANYLEVRSGETTLPPSASSPSPGATSS